MYKKLIPIAEHLICEVETQMEDLENVCTKELGEVIDMIKDLSKAIYYDVVTEAMLEKGIGMYNFWVHKSNQSLPAEVLAKNSSCRGICCVDTVKPTGWYGWALLFDQDGEIYTQYIRNAEPKDWKALATK